MRKNESSEIQHNELRFAFAFPDAAVVHSLMPSSPQYQHRPTHLQPQIPRNPLVSGNRSFPKKIKKLETITVERDHAPFPWPEPKKFHLIMHPNKAPWLL
jgi:hypothetical protein